MDLETQREKGRRRDEISNIINTFLCWAPFGVNSISRNHQLAKSSGLYCTGGLTHFPIRMTLFITIYCCCRSIFLPQFGKNHLPMFPRRFMVLSCNVSKKAKCSSILLAYLSMCVTTTTRIIATMFVGVIKHQPQALTPPSQEPQPSLS